MAASASNTTSPSIGTLGITPFLPVSSAPPIIFEWVSLIPLVIYLSTYRHSYKLVGKAALGCSLGVALFPKLGILSSIANFLEEGSEYLDRACSMSELRKEVWDANFGSKFPCANGAASEIIMSSVLQRGIASIPMPATRSPRPHQKGTARLQSEEQPRFHRYQTLHVVHCTHQSWRPALSHRIFRLCSHVAIQVLIFIVLLGVSAISCLFGLYGTGAAVLSSALFHLCRQFIRINRPDTYLLNNERDNNAGCMLAGIHQNASTWYLYIGERGIIDSLLNKSMILSITTIFGDTGTKYLASFLRLLALLQLLSMTFVAAQKAWDGVGMLVLIVVAWISDLVIYGDGQLTKRWLSSSGIGMKTKSFQFTGRAILIGAIQVFKKNPVERWMDEILAPSDRRAAWLARLKAEDISPGTNALGSSLSTFDKEWVELNLDLTLQAVKILRREFPME
jgi:hypothetical protein